MKHIVGIALVALLGCGGSGQTSCPEYSQLQEPCDTSITCDYEVDCYVNFMSVSCTCENGSWQCGLWDCFPPPDAEDVTEAEDLPTEGVQEVMEPDSTEELPSEDTPVAPDTPGDDTTLGIPPCNGVPNNAPCDTKGAECADTSQWCGSMVTHHECHCSGTEWQCISAGAPLDCHECCQEAMGGMYFCSDGQCLKASGCLAMNCCVPGPQGDAWCKGTFSECSKCMVVSNDGRCNPVDCGG